MRELAPLGLAGKVIGGGRIEFEPKKRLVNIFGYSKTFGRCPKYFLLVPQLHAQTHIDGGGVDCVHAHTRNHP